MKPEKYPGAVGESIKTGEKLGGELLLRDCNVHGVKTRLMTNSDRVARAMKSFLSAFPEGPDTRPDIEVFLFTTDELSYDMAPVPDTAEMMYDWGMVKIFHSGTNRFEKVDHRARVVADIETRSMAGFAEEGLLQTDWLISNLFFYPVWAQLLKQSGLFPLHAAGLTREGSSVLFLGKSGSGKSTLSIHLVSSGYGLLSDDTVFLREEGGKIESLSFPEEINVSEQTIKLIPELAKVSKFKRNDLRQKSSFAIEELYPDCVVDSAVPSVLIFPELTDSSETSFEPMSGTEALTLSMRYAFFFMDPATTGRHFEMLSLLVNQASCFRMYSGTDQELLARAVDDLLNDNLQAT